MSVDSDSFLKLCQKLRDMGAVKIEGYGFCAIFPVSAPPRALPNKGAGRQKAEAAEKLTDEQLAEYRRRLELGQV
jgi:hypothetical protein